jgi:hypothetical protein
VLSCRPSASSSSSRPACNAPSCGCTAAWSRSSACQHIHAPLNTLRDINMRNKSATCMTTNNTWTVHTTLFSKFIPLFHPLYFGLVLTFLTHICWGTLMFYFISILTNL